MTIVIFGIGLEQGNARAMGWELAIIVGGMHGDTDQGSNCR